MEEDVFSSRESLFQGVDETITKLLKTLQLIASSQQIYYLPCSLGEVSILTALRIGSPESPMNYYTSLVHYNPKNICDKSPF